MEPSLRFRRCPLCSSQKGMIIEDHHSYRVVECSGCGLIYVDPLPPTDVLEKAYSKDYYTPWLTAQRRRRVSMWKRRLRLLNRLSGSKGRLLDVGCGEGLFLEIAREDGWEVVGTEFSAFAAELGKRLGLDVYHGELMDIAFPPGEFDAITMWHVLEHTRDPVRVLKEARRILKGDGILIVAVPNLDNIPFQLVYRLVRGRRMALFDPGARELHLYHFRPSTIRRILEGSGFEVIRVLPDTGIIQWHMRVLNYLAVVLGVVTGRLLTDGVVVYGRPS